ncbi:uncharacterized protein (TIGR04222 family) [Herbihabitans rhizosphaerae]|uniref:Uncharacterized protein (TIGR04222 family) n=1 Tax=Herbihabitans rhizosphaerae TaxID=1872711 RepID=A0A4Q7KDH3_9PSEU|nr:TIGR04222 domain-containing membrane protein [Herbihabitans rhizosphaerae]RZS31435.1 uncharacterized protein (TIGR04222 family) [Herbihabitans rhizosphaerae]
MERPWGMSGPEFLGAYWAAMALACVIVLIAFWWTRGTPADAVPADTKLDAYELAMLAGGPRRVQATAIAALVAGGHLRVSRARITVRNKDELDDRLLQYVRANATQRRRRAAFGRSLHAVQLADTLVEQGLLVEPARLRKARRSLVVLGLVGAFGVIRLANGVRIGAPVGYLLLSLLGTAVIWWSARRLFTPRGPVLTGRGRRVLAQAQAGTQRKMTDVPVAAGVGAMAFAPIALYGYAAYGDDQVGDLLAEHTTSKAAGGGAGGSGCGSHSCSGCGGSSGCGGGGGGCGGGGN